MADQDLTRRHAAGIARGAAVIASLTVLSRIFGLVRTLVFSQRVGASCLGTAYITANQVPNLVYDLVVGGALTSAMIPVLARSAERAADDPRERARVSQISSALLTWTVILLLPLTVVVAAAAGPIADLLNPANANARCDRADVVAVTGSMLAVFSPQILLSGLSVVLYGLLQAYRRFAAPALGPAISSLVVISAYLAFAPANRDLPLSRLPLTAELILSVGTTLGVAALVAVAVWPTWRLHLTFRPQLRFPPGVARRAGGLALIGVIEIVAYDLSIVVALVLANGRGSTGAVVLLNYGWQVFNSVNGVLALSVAVSAFPVLAAREGQVFDRTCAGSTRAVLLVGWLGAALTAAVAAPAAHVLAREPDQVSQLIAALALFAPGLVGFGVIATMSRVMMVLGRLKIAAVAVAGSWLVVIAADAVLAVLVPARLVVAALALGNTIGQLVVAVPLVLAARRIRGPEAVRGTGRAALAGGVAGVAGAVAGVAVSLALPASDKLLATGVAVLAAAVAVLAFGLVVYLLNDGDLRAAISWLRQVTRRVPDEALSLPPSSWAAGVTWRAGLLGMCAAAVTVR
jgi:putative peptidoglycan lipid II flippase